MVKDINVNELVHELMIFCSELKFDLDLQQMQQDVKSFNFETLWIFMQLLFGDYYYLCSPLNNDQIPWLFYRRLEDLHYKMVLMNYNKVFDKNECNDLVFSLGSDAINKKDVENSFRVKLLIATESKKLIGENYFNWSKLFILEDTPKHAEINKFIILAIFISVLIIINQNNAYLTLLDELILKASTLISLMVMDVDKVVTAFARLKGDKTKQGKDAEMFNYLSGLILDVVEGVVKSGGVIKSPLSFDDPIILNVAQNWYQFNKDHEIKSYFSKESKLKAAGFANWLDYSNKKTKKRHLDYLEFFFEQYKNHKF